MKYRYPMLTKLTTVCGLVLALSACTQSSNGTQDQSAGSVPQIPAPNSINGISGPESLLSQQREHLCEKPAVFEKLTSAEALSYKELKKELGPWAYQLREAHLYRSVRSEDGAPVGAFYGRADAWLGEDADDKNS